MCYIQDRTTITNSIQNIAAVALSNSNNDQLGLVLEKHLQLTEHDCYKSVTQHIQEKCFDLQVRKSEKQTIFCTFEFNVFTFQNEFVLNKLYIMANLCQIGLRDYSINQSIDYVCHKRLHLDY